LSCGNGNVMLSVRRQKRKEHRRTTFGCFFSKYSVEGKSRKKHNLCLLFLFKYSVGDTIEGKGYPVMDNFSFSYCSVSFNQDPN
jgi:hypothetical protein